MKRETQASDEKLLVENASLRERVASLLKIKNAAADVTVLWSDFTSQEMYGESLTAALPPDELAEMNLKIENLRTAVRELPPPTTTPAGPAPAEGALQDEARALLATFDAGSQEKLAHTYPALFTPTAPPPAAQPTCGDTVTSRIFPGEDLVCTLPPHDTGSHSNSDGGTWTDATHHDAQPTGEREGQPGPLCRHGAPADECASPTPNSGASSPKGPLGADRCPERNPDQCIRRAGHVGRHVAGLAHGYEWESASAPQPSGNGTERCSECGGWRLAPWVRSCTHETRPAPASTPPPAKEREAALREALEGLVKVQVGSNGCCRVCGTPLGWPVRQREHTPNCPAGIAERALAQSPWQDG